MRAAERDRRRELLAAARAYLTNDMSAWPWEAGAFEPTGRDGDPSQRDLARAGELIAAAMGPVHNQRQEEEREQ